MGSETIIKTTAKFQDNSATKQKPIIQVEAPLPNTIRASLETSVRDNPFRPNGKIYKSADPIVEYYKYGPNQSRPVSPSDSQQLLGTGGGPNPGQVVDEEANKKWKKKRAKRDRDLARGRKISNLDGSKGNPLLDQRVSCWKRWLCCCCYSKCCKRKQNDSTIQYKATSDESLTRLRNEESNIQQYSPTPALDAKTREFKPAKIVMPPAAAKDNQSSSIGSIAFDQQTNSSTKNSISVEFLAPSSQVKERPVSNDKTTSAASSLDKQQTTQVKKSRCIVS